VDPVVARRTILGAPVVHGIHLVLWAVDRALALLPKQHRGVASIKAVFRKPVYLDREVVLESQQTTDEIEVLGSTSDGRCLEIALHLRPSRERDPETINQSWAEPIAPENLEASEATRASGSVELSVEEPRARAAFPAACDQLGVALVAELLATTRIVGMHCPGLHSLFKALSLKEASSARDHRVEYSVADSNLKYSLLTLCVSGPQLHGTLETFYRPHPVEPLAIEQVAARVAPQAFADQRALVVGGSRGLGEAFAKLIAVGGGEVCLTYHRGEIEANRIVADCTGAGLTISAVRFDVLAPTSLRDVWPFSRPPTHLYYLATPVLYSIRKGATFSSDELRLLIRYFVDGLYSTTKLVVETGTPHLVVWTPSTSMLDSMEGVTYCIAKAAMEELCRHLPTLLPTCVHAPRIGRIHTDQTIGLMQQVSASPLDVALASLHRLSE
jgi:NAD(P)-dependent dehydrogenase (short-subunit alcohol dehydrogenase family)